MVYFRTVHLESHDKNDQTQKMAYGSTKYCGRNNSMYKQYYIDKHDVIRYTK